MAAMTLESKIISVMFSKEHDECNESSLILFKAYILNYSIYTLMKFCSIAMKYF